MGTYLVHPVTQKTFPRQVVLNGQTIGVGALALVPTAGSAPTINAPPGAVDRSAFAVRDADGNAGTNAITVNGNGALIDGAASVSLARNGIEAVFVWDTTRSPAQWARTLPFRVYSDEQSVPLVRARDVRGSVAPAPTITSITDDVGDTAGGVPVTVKGTNFTGATGATVGGVALTSFTVVNATTITGVTGAHAKGVVDVSVQHPSGNATLPNGYEYWNPSSLASCVWWLRADLGITVDGSGQVIAWIDQSGIGDANRQALAASVTDRAAWNASDAAYNNKATIGTFAKLTNTRLSTGVWSASYPTFTLGVVGHAATDSNRYFEVGTGSSAQHGLLNLGNKPSAFGATSGSILSKATGGGFDVPASFGMAEWNGASSALYVNATSTPDVTGPLTGTALGSSIINVGAHSAGSSTFGVAAIAELFAFNTILSAGDKGKLTKYLNGRYAKSMST